MGSLVEVDKTSELEDGTMKKVLVQGHEILLARVDGRYYATDNRCPHLGGNLSAGTLEGTIITCPLQGSQFDLRDGKVVRWLNESLTSPAVGKSVKPPKPLNTYNTRIDDGKIMIEI